MWRRETCEPGALSRVRRPPADLGYPQLDALGLIRSVVSRAMALTIGRLAVHLARLPPSGVTDDR